MDAKKFLEDFVTEAATLFKLQRSALAKWLEDEQIEVLTTKFLMEGNQDQLAILAFRLRTWARSSNVTAIRRAHEKLYSLLSFAGRLLIEVVTP